MAIISAVNLSVQIPSGPNVSVNWNVAADAYSRATVTVPNGLAAGTAGTTLELQPSAGAALLLLITSSDYSGNVTYNFGGNSWKMAGPQIISGTGLANALALKETIVFDTSSANVKAPVTFDVLVLRTAVV